MTSDNEFTIIPDTQNSTHSSSSYESIDAKFLNKTKTPSQYSESSNMSHKRFSYSSQNDSINPENEEFDRSKFYHTHSTNVKFTDEKLENRRDSNNSNSPKKNYNQSNDNENNIKQKTKINDPSDPNSCDFVLATQYGFTDRCVYLLEHEKYNVALTDAEGICPLHWAAINNRADLIRIFISYDAILDQIGGDLSATPLHWAVRQGCFLACRVLLDAGADPTILDNEGYTTLHIAAEMGFWQILCLILSYSNGQHLDIKDLHGRTPIQKAIIGKQMETTRVLCALGAKLNCQDKNLNNVIHTAVKENFAGGIQAILNFVMKHTASGNVNLMKGKAGASMFPSNLALKRLNELLSTRNGENHTPISQSNSNQSVYCAKILEQFESIIPESITGKKLCRPKPKCNPNQKCNFSNCKEPNFVTKFINNLLFKIFGIISPKSAALITYSFPLSVLILFTTICSIKVPIWPVKILMCIVLYLLISYVSNNIVTAKSMKFFPLGLTSSIKVYGMTLGLFHYSRYMSLYWCISWFIACPATWYCLYRCVFGDPGFITQFNKKHDKTKAFNDLRKIICIIYETPGKQNCDYRLCTSCMVRKPLRSKHTCEGMIDNCVGRFDHYCPWVLNAIGFKNQHWFLAYLFNVLVISGIHGYAGIDYLHNQCNLTETLTSQKPYNVLLCDPCTTILLTLMVIFVIWVFLLLVTQLWIMIIEGNTTNENINYQKYTKQKANGSDPQATIKAQQFKPLKMTISSRFLDLFRLKRRNVDWATCYCEDDLIKGGLLKRIEDSFNV